MNINNAYILEDRGIIFVEGSEAKDFLQNIITNNINKVNNQNSCFASLLTPQGKFLYDFLIIQHKNGYFIDCEKAQIDDLFKQLTLYKLRSDVQLLNLSNEFVVTAFSYEKYKSFKESKDELGFTFKYNEDPIFLDPRNKKLGGRSIINLEKLYMSLKKLELKSSNVKEYYQLSFDLGIQQKNTIKLKDKLFALECNFEELNAIDFKKGCYVGQENTSRIKLKNKLTKRLMPIKIISGKLSEEEKIYNNNVEIGKVLINEEYPFALIKYLDKNFDKNQIFETKKGSFKIFVPEWLKI